MSTSVRYSGNWKTASAVVIIAVVAIPFLTPSRGMQLETAIKQTNEIRKCQEGKEIKSFIACDNDAGRHVRTTKVGDEYKHTDTMLVKECIKDGFNLSLLNDAYSFTHRKKRIAGSSSKHPRYENVPDESVKCSDLEIPYDRTRIGWCKVEFSDGTVGDALNPEVSKASKCLTNGKVQQVVQ